MNDNNRSYWSSSTHYESNPKKYQILVMDTDGKVTTGRTYDNWEEMYEAMIELRVLYAKHEVKLQVGYMEVR